MRPRIAYFFAGLIFLGLGSGLFRLQVMQGAAMRQLSDKNCLRVLAQPGARGNIVDRNNQMLADNDLSYDLLVAPFDRSQVERVLAAAAAVVAQECQ